MELLEKITLYDILGYTFPGGITLYILNKYNFEQKFSTFGIIIFIVMSFLVGVLISEIASWFFTKLFSQRKKFQNKIWKKTGLDCSVIAKALKNSGSIEDENSINDASEVSEHFINMYSDIQTDKEYSRIHNYASAGLLCKNMAIVSFICAIQFLFDKCSVCSDICSTFIDKELMKIIVSIAALIIFSLRWIKFERKKISYTINWYVQKHNESK